MISSIVIVSNSKGYIASLRFTEQSKDRDIASASKYVLGLCIDDYLKELGEYCE